MECAGGGAQGPSLGELYLLTEQGPIGNREVLEVRGAKSRRPPGQTGLGKNGKSGPVGEAGREGKDLEETACAESWSKRRVWAFEEQQVGSLAWPEGGEERRLTVRLQTQWGSGVQGIGTTF